LAAEYRIAFIPEPLLRAFWAAENISSGHDRSLAEAEALILEKHRATFAAAGDDILSHRLWHLAHLRFMCGEMTAGRKSLREARKAAPRASHLLFLALSINHHLYRAAYGVRSLRRDS
jgi:hypothetical protein